MRLNLKAMLLGAAALLATAIAGPLTASAAGDPNTLVVGKAGDADNLDPAVTMTNNSWTVTYDGLQWTFTLADGHKFADGTPVNAAAVKYSFDRLLKVAKGPSESIGP